MVSWIKWLWAEWKGGFWKMVRHRRVTGPNSTLCTRCGYHYNGLHKERT